MTRFSAILLFLMFSSLSYAQSKLYDLKFDQTTIDLGEIKKGEKVDGVFRFRNTGSAALRIELVSACECTTLDWTRSEIEPNQYGEVKFTFDSSKKEEDEVIDVDIYFENQDPETEEYLFEIVSYSYKLI